MGWAFATAMLLGQLAPSDGATAGGRLAMSPAVVCEQVAGYRDYQARPDATLTADEKLFVYYEPSGHAIRREGTSYVAHLAQDARIRRKGQGRVVYRKDEIVDLRVESPTPPTALYLGNTIALKGLAPGAYELEILLRDRLAGDATATQVVPFTIVPSRSRPSGRGAG